jgi:hypothetical protein
VGGPEPAGGFGNCILGFEGRLGLDVSRPGPGTTSKNPSWLSGVKPGVPGDRFCTLDPDPDVPGGVGADRGKVNLFV